MSATLRKAATVGFALAVFLSSAVAQAAWQRSVSAMHGYVRYGTWSGCTQSTSTLTPTEDSYVDSASPTVVENTSDPTRLFTNGPATKMIYLKFTAGTFTPPAGCVISGATLTIKQASTAAATANKTLTARAITGSWAESTLTFNNKPNVGTVTSASATLCCSNSLTFTWDVRAAARDATDNGLRVEQNTSGNNGFWSKDQNTDVAGRPKLIISYSAP